MRMRALLAAGVLWFGAFNGLYSVPKAIEAPRAPWPKDYIVQGEGVKL
ncbi:hypothetical protein PALU110988_27310 [Paenibacillus lupini]|nr:hypothetical protein [Paenibacillus lupini]NIK24192.1 hypothetical protein [Paenibacillus lupini]